MNSLDVGLLDPATSHAAACVGDAAYLAAMVEAELALLGALADVDGAPASVRDIALDGLLGVLSLGEVAERSRAGGNPVIPLLAALRPQLPAEAQGVLHFGATSQDVLDTATMLVAERSRIEVARRLEPVLAGLVALADEQRHTPVAGRTLGQQGAPTTFGLRAAVLLDGVRCAADGLAALELPAQLGGSVGTLAVLVDALGEDRAVQLRRRYAERLGLAARDGVWHVERGVVAGLGAALAILIGALGRLGLEVAQGARTELGELALDLPELAGGSSTMPQKRNPVAAVLLIAAARRASGLVTTLLGAQLALDDRPTGEWHAEWQPLRELLRLALESAALADEAVAGLIVDTGRMRANLDAGGGRVHAERVQWVLVPVLGRPAAAALVRDALEAPDFVSAVLAAVESDERIPDPGAVARRLRAVTALGGAVGLSDRLIDAALDAVRPVGSPS